MKKFFKVGYYEWDNAQPPVWLQKWSELFLSSDERREDDRVYESLIQKKGKLSGEDFEQIGRWKEGCLLKGDGKEHGRWKPKTPAAYDVWMEAKRNPPLLPPDGNLDDKFAENFLKEWSEKRFAMPSKGGKVRNVRFGLSRASTLLHFLSGGRFPIYDSLVWYALRRMTLRLPWEMTIDPYLKQFCHHFYSIASSCGLDKNRTDELRKLDNALRCYGKRERCD